MSATRVLIIGCDVEGCLRWANVGHDVDDVAAARRRLRELGWSSTPRPGEHVPPLDRCPSHTTTHERHHHG